MDVKIQAVLIGASFSLLGVFIGGWVQAWLRDRDVARDKKIAEGAVCIYLCKTRDMFFQFSEQSNTLKLLALGISANENNTEEVNRLISIIEKYDPHLLVMLFDVRQRLGNIQIYTSRYYKQSEVGEKSERLLETVALLNVDGKHGLKDIDTCIKHAFNNAESESRKYLLQNEAFKGFLATVLGDRTFKYHMLKLGLSTKI